MVRRILAAGLAILLVSESVAADVVVLRDGKQYTGIVLNHAQLKGFASSVTSVYYQSAPADSLQEFPRSLVRAVILEDSTGHRQTIALNGERETIAPADSAGVKPTMVPITPPIFEKGHPGVGWMLTGAALLVVGSSVKFGEDPEQAALPPIAREGSYNWGNYAIMAVGSGMMLAGVGIAKRASFAMSQTRAMLGPPEPTVAVTLHF
jgi:hypothetical protein